MVATGAVENLINDICPIVEMGGAHAVLENLLGMCVRGLIN